MHTLWVSEQKVYSNLIGTESQTKRVRIASIIWRILSCSPLEIIIYCRYSADADFTEAQAKRNALRTIKELANFYNTIIWSDKESESDATEVLLQDMTVDDYMEALLAEWGMDWQKTLKLGMQHMQAQLQQVGAKRVGEASSKNERKTGKRKQVK